MNLLPLFEWFEATWLGATVRQSIWMFPVIECFHLLALALLGGVILVVDMRTLGLGLRTVDARTLDGQVARWRNGALVMIVVTGVVMFLSEAVKCYYSPPFWYKIGLLMAATAFTYTWRRRFTAMTAAASLALWFGVAFAGRWIAFY